MTWQKMRLPGGSFSGSLPGERGRYLLWLESPLVEGEGHYVHFSWKAESFCIRDYLQQLERRQVPGMTATDIWETASDRIPCKGELYMPVENFEFWTEKLRELTEKRKRGTSTGLGWSRLSSKFFSPKRQESSQQPKNRPSVYDHRQGEKGSFYPNFMELWKKKNGFDVIERTVGCSARYHGEPLLWVYPSYFQLAPEGKGNRHHRELKERLYANFPEANGKGTIQFAADYINWERFESFVLEVQRMIEDESR